jgi:hypothetical protein
MQIVVCPWAVNPLRESERCAGFQYAQLGVHLETLSTVLLHSSQSPIPTGHMAQWPMHGPITYCQIVSLAESVS